MSEALVLTDSKEPAAGTPTAIGRRALRLVGETAELPSPEVLYSRILPLEYFPDIEVPADASPIILRIRSANSFTVGSEVFVLGSQQMFFFNAMMLLRDRPSLLADYYELGRVTSPPSDVYRVVGGLMRGINEAAGDDVITSAESPTRLVNGPRKPKEYRINPRLRLEDSRHGRSRFELPLNPDVEFEPAIFKSSEERDQAFFSILGKYQKSPRINYLLSHVEQPQIEDPSFSRSLDRSIQVMARHRLLGAQEVTDLYRRIERGLSIYQRLQGDIPELSEDGPVSDDKAALIEAAASYQVMYGANMKLVISQIKRSGITYDNPLFVDSLQNGAIGLGIAIRRFDYQRGVKFSTFAIHWIDQEADRQYAKTCRPIKVPDDKHDQIRSVSIAKEHLRADLQREPTPAEIVDRIGFFREQVIKKIDELKKAELKMERWRESFTRKELDEYVLSRDLTPEELGECMQKAIVELEELTRIGSKSLVSLNSPVSNDGYAYNEDELGDFVPDTDEALEAMLKVKQPRISAWHKLGQEILGLSQGKRLAISLRFGIYLEEFEGHMITNRITGKATSYQELMEDLHKNGGELSDAIIADFKGIEDDSAKSVVDKALTELRKKVEVNTL